MTIREAIKEQRKSIKNRSLKERFSFFWEYYALKTFALLALVIVVVAFIISMATKKEFALTAMFFGAEATQEADSYLSDFAKAAAIDQKKYELTVQLGPDVQMDQQVSTEIYQSMETFVAMVAAGSMDCFAAREDHFLYYAYMDYAMDLRTVLSGEELQRLAPYLYYVDAALIRRQEEAFGGYTDAYMQRPDPTKPEEMEDPVPVAISVAATTQAFQSSYRFPDTTLLGLCASSEQKENALAFFLHCLATP